MSIQQLVKLIFRMVWGIRSTAQHIHVPFPTLFSQRKNLISFLFSTDLLSLCCNCFFIFCTFLPHLLYKLHLLSSFLFYLLYADLRKGIERPDRHQELGMGTAPYLAEPRNPSYTTEEELGWRQVKAEAYELGHRGWILMVRTTACMPLRRFLHILHFIPFSVKWE